MDVVRSLKADVVHTLHELLHGVNPFVRVFKNAFELFRDRRLHEMSIIICADDSRAHDRRLYNAPCEDDVAVIVPDGHNNDLSLPRDIVLRTRSDAVQRIDECSRVYEPLHYVLMFPDGRFGWNPGFKDRNDRAVTLKRYAMDKLAVRNKVVSNPHHYGRLFMQYACDLWVRMEQHRLRYFTLPDVQRKLRCEVLQVCLCCCGIVSFCGYFLLFRALLMQWLAMVAKKCEAEILDGRLFCLRRFVEVGAICLSGIKMPWHAFGSSGNLTCSSR